uniref:F-box domain-containing protein n=1 Tax=Oryza glaberrima TaxID=4538 RepID=I1R6I0_ORYGL
MDGDDDRWGHVHRDIFGEILKRLPPISGRRRIRLICRRWRDGVDEMEPEMATTMRAKPLAVLKDSRSRTLSAFVVDGLPPAPRRATTRCIFQHVDDGGGGGGHHRHRYDRWPNNVGDQVVGTCNGILLLAHSRYVGSHTLVLLNSATGERLVVQPPPKAKEIMGGSAALSFAYHPLTGEYKVVHLPVSSWKRTLAVAEVLTVGDGDASWRQVPAPAGSTCYLSWGVVSVDGATSPPPPPTTATMGVDNGGCHLTEVGGRLGVAIATSQRGTTNVEVWVLHGRGDKQHWIRWCSMQGLQQNRKIGHPCFAFDKYVLTNVHHRMYSERSNLKYMCLPPPVDDDGIILMRFDEKADVQVTLLNTSFELRLFAHVETSEPLEIYKKKNVKS